MTDINCKNCKFAKFQKTEKGNIRTSISGRCEVSIPKPKLPYAVLNHFRFDRAIYREVEFFPRAGIWPSSGENCECFELRES